MWIGVSSASFKQLAHELNGLAVTVSAWPWLSHVKSSAALCAVESRRIDRVPTDCRNLAETSWELDVRP